MNNMDATSTAIVHSATMRGAEALRIEVEVSVNAGIPGFSIIGMADASVQESRERVKAALRSCGFAMPAGRIVINLSPGALRKSGSQFDLPIAAAVLCLTGSLNPATIDGLLLVGELSMTGEVLPTKHGLVYGLCARDEGLSLMSSEDDGGASRIAGLNRFHVATLKDLDRPNPAKPTSHATIAPDNTIDFADIPGNESAKRALQIAAAGGHGALLIGAPHSDAAALAARMPTILPPLTTDEALESAAAHSAASYPVDAIIGGSRPFRSPHHSASLAGLVGGGSPIKPGETALAHNGVLFLDNLQDFAPSTLQGLRQPAVSGHVVITRADGNVDFPTRFQLVAAAFSCPCGYYGEKEGECVCSAGLIQRYRSRLGGPLRNLLAIQAHVQSRIFAEAHESHRGTSSEALREGVLRAREFVAWRRARKACDRNRLGGIVEECSLPDETLSFLEKVAQKTNMSGSVFASTLAVARTIADMGERESVRNTDIIEACSLRGTH